MANNPSDDNEPVARAQLKVRKPILRDRAPETQHAQDALGGPIAGDEMLPNGYDRETRRPLFPPFHHQSVNPLRALGGAGELGHGGRADVGTVMQGFTDPAVPQQVPHDHWQMGAAAGGQAQNSTQDAELQQRLQLRGAGFANAASSLGLQVGQQLMPLSQQAGAVGSTGTTSYGDVQGQYHAGLPAGLTQETMRALAHKDKKAYYQAQQLQRQQPIRQADPTTGKPSLRLRETRQQYFEGGLEVAASPSHTQALPPAQQTRHAALPHPLAMYTPQGTFLWSWDRSMYIFAENTRTGVSPKLICEGFLQGYHGAWVEPDPEEIARRGGPSGVCPMMTFFPDGVGIEEARAWMFGGRYPCYPQPKEKAERDRMLRAEEAKGRSRMSAVSGVGGTTAVETKKWDGRGVLKPVALKKARKNGGPREPDRPEKNADTQASLICSSNINSSSKTSTHRNTNRPTAPSIDPGSRSNPTTHVKNPYEYFVDPGKVLVQAFPAETPNALDTKFDYQPSQPLTAAIDGDDFVLSEYCTWPASALSVTVKATGEVLLLTASVDGLLMAEDQRLRGDVEMKKKKKV